MNLIIRVFTIVSFVSIFGSLAAQADLTVYYFAGHKVTYNLEKDGKLFFEGDELKIQKSHVGDIESIQTDLIQKITFEEAGIGTSKISTNSQNITISPNPATHTIRLLSNRTDDLHIKIFDPKGQQCLSGSYPVGSNIDINHFIPGIYVVQVNGVILKLMKL